MSDAHRYVFIEQAHTACTAIAAELREHYEGRPILTKHATYAAFLRVATPEQRRYFAFSGIRNPLDEAVSLYFKYRTDHKSKYTRQRARMGDRRGAKYDLVTQGDLTFPEYLRRFHRKPFENDTVVHHERMDVIIRFEHLQDDFSEVLRRLGLEQVRPLPLVNPTAGRGSYLDYYTPEVREHAVRVFGPFMERWGYELPPEWGLTVPGSARLLYRTLRLPRYVHRRYVRSGTGRPRGMSGGRVGRAARTLARPLARPLIRLIRN